MLCEFCEVAFHEILCQREVYPKEVFEPRKRYGMKVHMSRHPELNEYIYNVIDGARQWMKKDNVHSISISILSEDRRPLERFVFDMQTSMSANTEFDQQSREAFENALKGAVFRLKLFLNAGSDGAQPISNKAGGSFVAMVRMRDEQNMNEENWMATSETEAAVHLPEVKPIAHVESPLLVNIYTEQQQR